MEFHKPKLFKEFIIATVLSLILALIFTFPGVLSLNSNFLGDGYDNYQIASYQSLAFRQIQHGYFPFSHTNFWRYPNGFDFQRGFDFYLPIIIGLFFRFALSIPLSYNLTVITLMTLNGLFSYLYFSRLSRSKLLGAIGAVMYGFSFYTIAKAASHPNLLFVGGIPLLLYGLLRIYRSIMPSVIDYSVLVGGILFVALGSVQYTILTSMMLAFYFIISCFSYPQQTRFFFRKILESYKNMIYPFLIGAAVIAIFYAPIITALLSGQIYVTNRDKTLFQETPNLLDFILPNNYLRIYIAKIFNNPSNPSIERAVFMGFIEIGLFITFFFSKISKKFKKYILFIFLIPLLLSFGYGRDNSFFLLPYHLLGHIFPFSLISETGRYVIFFTLVATSAVVLFMAQIQNVKKRNIFGILLIAFLILERIPTMFYVSPDFAKEKFIEAVKTQKSEAVLDIPVDYFDAKYNLYSLYYDKPIVNGYFHWSADGPIEQAFVGDRGLINRFVCDEKDPISKTGLNAESEIKTNQDMLTLLTENGVKTIVIHKEGNYLRPVCDNVRLHLNTLLPNIQTLPASITDEEKQFVLNSTNDKPSFTVYFPKAGKLYISGIYIAPAKPAKFSINYNDLPVSFDYKWDLAPNNSMQMQPQRKVVHDVSAGSKMTIYSDRVVPATYFSIWYRYIPSDANQIIQSNSINKIFEDEKSSVYQIK